MSMPSTIIEKWEQLDEEDKRQTATFIDFLLLRHLKAKKEQSKKTAGIQFGIWNKEPCYIADDFDDTPEDFKEYTQRA